MNCPEKLWLNVEFVSRTKTKMQTKIIAPIGKIWKHLPLCCVELTE